MKGRMPTQKSQRVRLLCLADTCAVECASEVTIRGLGYKYATP